MLKNNLFYILHLATIIIAIFTAASIVAARSFAVISTIIAAATFRAGWNLPNDFGPGRLDDVLAATGNPYAKNLSLYGYVRAGGKYVEHDVFVSGNNDHDSLGVAEEHWVGELEYGIAMAYKRFMLHWSNRHITEEFEQQERSHIVGVWMFSWSQPF